MKNQGKPVLEFLDGCYHVPMGDGQKDRYCVLGAIAKAKSCELPPPVYGGHGIFSAEKSITKLRECLVKKTGLSESRLSSMQGINDRCDWDTVTNMLVESGLYDAVKPYAMEVRKDG